MNLAGLIPDHARIKAEKLLRSVSKENIHVDTSSVHYYYPLTEEFRIMLSIRNQRRIDCLHYAELIDMLLAYPDVVDLCIVAKDSLNRYNLWLYKASYPLSVLGDKGLRFLRDEDIWEIKASHFGLIGVTKVIDYLCILYNERPHFFDGER